MDLARLKRWLRRYGPAELTGVVTALLGSVVVHALSGSEVAAAFGGSIGETLGFYGVIVGREIRADAAAARGAGTRYDLRARLRTAGNLLVEFGPAEILDTGLIRPFTMGVGTRLLGRALGVTLGKLAADVTFYAPVILTYEWRRLRGRAAPSPPARP